ncbi:MAG: aspartate carbamoyltransferase [Candidatus Marinimicrobia bacterium]|nr:aspartate carbamoyltransferase [Candidatus Neomarinimicrobiota bacterium]
MSLISIKHLFGLQNTPKNDIEKILQTAFKFREVLDRPIKKVPSLKGKNVLSLFFENSTRTKMSFDLAAKRLSADVTSFSKGTSSLNKGESFKDTVQNIHSMKIDCIIIRHSSPGSCINLTNYVDASIINGGDGFHEHPTQALLDIMSLKEKFKSIKNLKVGIIGDILHSRVARSNIYGLTKLGAKVRVCGPSNLIPARIESLGVEVSHDIKDTVKWADALNVLRIQRERMGIGIIPSTREYRSLFGITSSLINKYNKDITILHPGPINRGVEVSSCVADGPNSIILNQVLNGVAVRMSVLYLLLGGGE